MTDCGLRLSVYIEEYIYIYEANRECTFFCLFYKISQYGNLPDKIFIGRKGCGVCYLWIFVYTSTPFVLRSTF